MDGDIVTVEEFVEGMFVKYINNDGVLWKNKNIDESLMKKAECFVHFTYEKSNKELMVLDIQGCDHTFFDPEVAPQNILLEIIFFSVGGIFQYKQSINLY